MIYDELSFLYIISYALYLLNTSFLLNAKVSIKFVELTT